MINIILVPNIILDIASKKHYIEEEIQMFLNLVFGHSVIKNNLLLLACPIGNQEIVRYFCFPPYKWPFYFT